MKETSSEGQGIKFGVKVLEHIPVRTGRLAIDLSLTTTKEWLLKRSEPK